MIDHAWLATSSLFRQDLRVEDFFCDRGLASESAVELKPEMMSQLLSRVAVSLERRTETVLEELRLLNAVVVHPAHPFYPPEFFELEKPPLFLSCLGNVELLRAPTRLAIVGSRELSARAESWLEHHLPGFLKLPASPVIVSGGARGADQAAHLAAIRAKKPTIVFVPSGLSRLFPVDLQTWVKPVLESGGLFVSLCQPGEIVRRSRFEARNRLIAAISHAVFVAEASRRSGSAMTARLATELGRGLSVLPSFPGEAVGQGTLDLLFNGATPIRDGEDLAVFASQARVSIPRAFERPAGRHREQRIREPHGDEGRQLSFS